MDKTLFFLYKFCSNLRICDIIISVWPDVQAARNNTTKQKVLIWKWNTWKGFKLLKQDRCSFSAPPFLLSASVQRLTSSSVWNMRLFKVPKTASSFWLASFRVIAVLIVFCDGMKVGKVGTFSRLLNASRTFRLHVLSASLFIFIYFYRHPVSRITVCLYLCVAYLQM